MNNPEPSRPASGSGDAVAARLLAGPSLEDLMGRIRLELTGSKEDALRTAKIANEAATHAKAGEALSVDEIMGRIRRELKQRSGGASDSTAVPMTSGPAQGHLPRWRSSVAPLPIQPMYVLADMLRPSDGEFVDNAFRILLRRSASAEEKSHYLTVLRGGIIGKVEMLGTIRFSDEGMQHGVHVDGLLIPYKLHKWRRIPVLGWFLAMGIALFRLPRLFAYLQRLEAAGAQESQQVGRTLNDLAQAVETHQTHLDEQLDTVAELQRQVQAKLSEKVSALVRTVDRLQEQLAMQASVSARADSRLGHLEQIEATTKVRLESMEASLLAQAAKQVGQLEAVMTARLESMQASLSGQSAEQVGELEAILKARLESVQAALSEQTVTRVSELETAMAGRLQSVQADQARVSAQLESRLDAGLSAVAKMTADSARVGRAVHDIERRLMAWVDRPSQQATGASMVAPSSRGEDQASAGLLDAHYVAFEDTFRGTRADIKERAGHYLTTFKDAGIAAGAGLVLDLGCGRGEWLEVLSEHGFASRGVDMNRVMVAEAQALGLDAVEQDAIAYLRSLDDESVAAVTSMHLVEHLPYEVLIRLVDEALRVLRPGGVLILETPNPENLTVGSYWFYMDPTHRNPIPPLLLQWVVEARGFEGAMIDRLTQNRGVFDIKPVGNEVSAANQINKIVGLLTAAPDYAIVARKPRAEIAQGQGGVIR